MKKLLDAVLLCFVIVYMTISVVLFTIAFTAAYFLFVIVLTFLVGHAAQALGLIS
jgi:hypothetical protein